MHEYGAKGLFKHVTTFDVKSQQFLIQSELSSPRACHSSTVCGQAIYIFGGNSGSVPIQSIDLLPKPGKNWQTIHMKEGTQFTAGAWPGVCTVSETKIFVFGGYN